MNKKVLTIILTLLFIVALVSLNVFMNGQTDMLNDSEESNEKINEQSSGEAVQDDVNILEVTEATFEAEVLQSDKVVLIDFYADWCTPCKILSPLVEEFANENDDVKVVKINVDNAEDLSMEYRIYSIPTLVAIKNGEEINRVVGVVDKATIASLVETSTDVSDDEITSGEIVPNLEISGEYMY